MQKSQVFRTAGNFEELEERVQRPVQQTTAVLLKIGLEEIDSLNLDTESNHYKVTISQNDNNQLVQEV
ncbi:hypothetical protein, partial [Syntrophothermus sp.]|uniref:hypothetical protein n=1 Tax=Syntrophothermus sp. TaxID=2736299 RepID=UPI00257B1FFA